MIKGGKVLSPSEFVLRNFYHSNLTICSIAISSRSISLEFIFSMVPIVVDYVCGISYIRGKPTRVNIGFWALTLASHAIFAAERCSRAISRHDHSRRRCKRIGEKHLKSVCSSGTHRKSCVPLLASFHMLPLSLFPLPPPLLFSTLFRFFLLYLSSVSACEIQENPRKIALSLTCETKVSEKKGMKSARGEIVVHKRTTTFCSLIGVLTFESFIALCTFICIILILRLARRKRDNFS